MRLDLTVQASAEAIGVNAPPVDPLPGACWVIGDTPESAWLGHAGEIAGWTEAGWRFIAPREGMQFWLGKTDGFARFIEGAWHSGETHGRLFVDGTQIVGPQAAAITEPVGGPVVDAEARIAVSAVLVALRAHGLIEHGGL